MATPAADPLLLTAARILTFAQDSNLTSASGFFFERDGRLYVVTSRHVVIDEPSGHRPDRIEIELHTDEGNLAKSENLSIPLYDGARSLWRQGVDGGGTVDVAAVPVDRTALPAGTVFRAFTPGHIADPGRRVEIGTTLLVVGCPLGFHDTLHHMPVARQAALASAFGLRFQGQGYFLTDGRTHRGTSGAPVVARIDGPGMVADDLPWLLLGVHSARLDLGSRDLQQDEALGLNCTWYADVLLTLTEE